ncbi:DNA-binding transcriptional regulator, LysR family [Tistlia consotensis]|uniref:DNA-binding transcriptional regulator, LysR family n=1 Tax=Tistlia consotensis USBA 355 TaxID=560819 RepID=A0A1Y6C6T2_9PROT|nr:LysR family transcriptional regulator [Tistlia consotensis]SMF46247.1 DNA-binding transcriptional regulator, LysR family [Tistlia consotensis USBA 355]SNR78714.1 DNA-binding transcriptional regulator, LysR family [Tistlia consotensis]
MKQPRVDLSEKFVGELDWNLLRTFVVIVQEGGITAAARRLLLRQPTVSLALQRLEGRLGTQLIERRRGVFRVTSAGRELYRECAEIYGSIARLADVATTASREVTGHVHISLASHVTTPLFDETLAAFHREHPGATYRIRIETSVDVARSVQESTASLGICLVNKRLPQLAYEVIYREFFGFFCGPPHPLFGRSGLCLEDLRGRASVSFDTDYVEDALRPVALLRRQCELGQPVVGQSPHLEEVRRMILCGLGIGPLPIHVVERDVRDGLLWRLPPYRDPPAIDIYLVTNPRRGLNRAEAGFIAALRRRISETPIAERTYAGPATPLGKVG